jgi:hypothetical protein
MQFILSNVPPIFKTMPLPVAGTLTVTACTWNATIYTSDPKKQPNFLPEWLNVASYLSKFHLLMQKLSV